MKKINMKRMMATALTAMMVMGIGTTAFANDSVTTDSTTIPLTKSVVVFNTGNSEIREPNISYTYHVTPANPENATVTDDSNASVTVKEGIAGAFTESAQISFSSENKHIAAQTGTEVEKSADLNIHTEVFETAGVYRYLITETPNTAVESAGLDAREDYSSIRYLDVYISNDGEGGLEMTGAVIFKVNENITTETGKTTGFEPSSDENGGNGGEGDDGNNNNYDYESDNNVDKYHTFNLEVAKITTGGLADLKNDFPFEITLTGDKAAAIIADYDNGDASYDGTAPDTIMISDNDYTLKPMMSDGDSVTITGIPAGTQVLVKETNNTPDTYKPEISTQTGFEGLELDKASIAKDESAQLKASAEIKDKTENSKIELTNTIETISPTGVVMRFAPYILILGAGIVILVLSRRRLAE